MYFSKKVKR